MLIQVSKIELCQNFNFKSKINITKKLAFHTFISFSFFFQFLCCHHDNTICPLYNLSHLSPALALFFLSLSLSPEPGCFVEKIYHPKLISLGHIWKWKWKSLSKASIFTVFYFMLHHTLQNRNIRNKGNEVSHHLESLNSTCLLAGPVCSALYVRSCTLQWPDKGVMSDNVLKSVHISYLN